MFGGKSVLSRGGSRGRRLLRFPKGSARLIERKLGLERFYQCLRVLLRGQFQGLASRLHRRGESSRLGVGGGQRAEKRRLSAAGELYRPAGQLDRLRPVADRGFRTGRQQPRQIVHISDLVRLQADRLAPLDDRLGELSLPVQSVAEVVVSLGEVGLDFQRLLKMDNGFVKPSALP